MRRPGRATLMTAAVAFLRSPQGQRMVSDARRRLDTPANRQRARELVTGLRSGRTR
jgi:hypothetical protein